MNERHFAKLVNKTPYYFWKMKEKEPDDLIRDEQGNIWVDEFGCTHSTNHKFKTYYRTYVGEVKVNYKLQSYKNDIHQQVLCLHFH